MEETATYARLKERGGPVPVSTKIYQGAGAWPENFKNFAFNTFLLFYYSQVLGIPATLASVAMGVALVFDAVSDPIVGSFSDNLRSRLGRRHPLMYAAALPLAFSLWGTFAPPGGLGEVGLFCWLLFFTISTRLALTLFLIPWSAMFAEFTDDYVERTAIVTYRYALGWAGGIAFTFLTWSFIFPATEAYPVGQLNPDAYRVFAPVVGLAVGLGVLFTTHMTRREVPYLYQPRQASRFRFRAVLHEVLLALENRNFLRIFLATLLAAVIWGTSGAFDLYMATYFWGFSGEDLRWLAFTVVGAIAAFGAVYPLQRRYDKKTLLVVGLIANMFLGMLFVSLRLLDVLPANGDPLLLVLFLLNATVRVAFGTVIGIAFLSMLADTLDDQELETGRRQEGVFSSAISFSAKAIGGFGVVIGGLVLDYVIRFPRGEELGQIAQETIVRLGVVDGLVMPLLFAAPIYLVAKYTLTRERHAEIRRGIDARREGERVSSAVAEP